VEEMGHILSIVADSMNICIRLVFLGITSFG
jgi:hypothetical protein